MFNKEWEIENLKCSRCGYTDIVNIGDNVYKCRKCRKVAKKSVFIDNLSYL